MSFIDPRALALLEANDQRLRTLNSVSGVVEQDQNATSRQVTTFRLMRPAFAIVRTDFFEKKTGSAAWTSSGYVSESRSDGKVQWLHHQAPGGKRKGARIPADPHFVGADVPLFIGMLNANWTWYQGFFKDPTSPARNDAISLRYEGVKTWRGAAYKAVRIRGAVHNEPLPWDGVARGRFSPITWARTQLDAVAVSYHYEYLLLIGADNLIHRETYTMHNGVAAPFVRDTQLRNVQINPPLTSGAFRFALPAASVNAAANP